MSHGWVVLRTQPRREMLACQAVDANGVESYVPMIKRQRRPQYLVPLFPGYLFARVALGSEDLLRIRSAPGIAYVLPRGGPPTIIGELIIDAIRQRLTDFNAMVGRQFRQGDHVAIARGPFQWMNGLFDRRLNAGGRVRILLEMASRTVTIELHEDDLMHTRYLRPV